MLPFRCVTSLALEVGKRAHIGVRQSDDLEILRVEVCHLADLGNLFRIRRSALDAVDRGRRVGEDLRLALIDAANIGDAGAGLLLDLQSGNGRFHMCFSAPPKGIHDPPCGPVIIVTCCAATGMRRAAAPRRRDRQSASLIHPPEGRHGADRSHALMMSLGLCGQPVGGQARTGSGTRAARYHRAFGGQSLPSLKVRS